MKSSKITTLICGLSIVALTIISYLLIFNDIFDVTIRWVSLLLILITEVIGITKALLIKRDAISQSTIFTSVAHLVAVFVLSILFVFIFFDNTKTYILLNVLILVALAAVDLTILHFGESSIAGDKKLAQSQGVMDACLSKAQGLAAVYGESDYKKELIEIAELIKYSDNSELTGDEDNIIAKLEELEAQLKENNEDIPALIAEIKNAIKLRTIKMRSIKRGGY